MHRLVQATLFRIQLSAVAVTVALAAWQLVEEPRVLPLWWGWGWLGLWVLAGLAAVLYQPRSRASLGDGGVTFLSVVGFALSVGMIASLRPALFDGPPPVGWLPIIFLFAPLGAALLGVIAPPPIAALGAGALIAGEWWVWARLVSASAGLGLRLGLVVALAVATSLAVARMKAAADLVTEAEGESAQARADAAACCAGAIEGARWDALVHDEVLATLELAARGDLASERLADRAGYTLRLVDRRGRPQPTDDATLVQRLKLTADSAGARLIVTSTFDGPLPGEVAEALATATHEAVRNARMHAAAQQITVEFARVEDCVEISVTDDGRGFVATSVASARMGLRVTVRGQVEAVGGWVDVRSAPGAGTRVVLRWGAGERRA